jgi:hypothetical protein
MPDYRNPAIAEPISALKAKEITVRELRNLAKLIQEKHPSAYIGTTTLRGWLTIKT